MKVSVNKSQIRIAYSDADGFLPVGTKVRAMIVAYTETSIRLKITTEGGSSEGVLTKVAAHGTDSQWRVIARCRATMYGDPIQGQIPFFGSTPAMFSKMSDHDWMIEVNDIADYMPHMKHEIGRVPARPIVAGFDPAVVCDAVKLLNKTQAEYPGMFAMSIGHDGRLKALLELGS